MRIMEGLDEICWVIREQTASMEIKHPIVVLPTMDD